MTLFTISKHTSEILSVILKSHQAPDFLLNQYIRSKKYIGSNDRKILVESLYSILRNYIIINFLADYLLHLPNLNCQQNNTKVLSKDELFMKICLYYLILHNDNPLNFNINRDIFKLDKEQSNIFFTQISSYLEEYFNIPLGELYHYIYIHIQELKTKESPLLYSFPEWILNYIHENKRFNANNDIAFMQSTLYPATIDLRVNTLRGSVDSTIKIISNSGIDYQKANISPVCLSLNKRYNLNEFDFYKNGLVEVQDQGSQLISYSIAPEKNWKILDACAGAGGKSLHLADLQEDKGYILATDIEFNRIKEIGKRAIRSGLKSIKSLHLNKNKPISDLLKNKKFDAVLIDAPCSGIGTLRRDPTRKLKLNAEIINKINRKQTQIIDEYSQYVNVGGYLVYATCSFLPQENEEIVTKFLENNPNFKPDYLKKEFDKNNIIIPELTDTDWYITLYPHIHKTDGFFISRMQRIS